MHHHGRKRSLQHAFAFDDLRHFRLVVLALEGSAPWVRIARGTMTRNRVPSAMNARVSAHGTKKEMASEA